MDRKKPNIILVFADDLGYGDLSSFNPDSKITTKNIDAIAESGMKFTDCHSSSALCTPSRYGLLTGRYNWRSRLKCAVLPGHASPLIEEGRETIASLLKKQGYTTACVGKWHLGMNWTTRDGYTLPETYSEPNGNQDLCAAGVDFSAPIKDGPNSRGFDYFYGMPASLDQPPFVHIENDKVLREPTNMIGVKKLDRLTPKQRFDVEYGPAEEGYDPSKIVPEMDEKVLALIDEYAECGEPFFIYYPTLAVHGPLVPADEFKGRSGLNEYADFVLQVDDFMGRLQEKLKEKNIEENTIVIFTSDNGCSPVADYTTLISKGHNPSYIFRGCKCDIWEGGHRVPFIIKWSEHIRPNTESSQIVCLTDVFATIAEICSIDYDDCNGEDSVSFNSLLQGKDEKVRDYIVHHSADGSFSVRKGVWKMEFCPGSGAPNDRVYDENDPKYQLYRLDGDISERYNLYGTQPQIEKELLLTLKKFIEDGRSTAGAPQPNYPWKGMPNIEWLDRAVEELDNG